MSIKRLLQVLCCLCLILQGSQVAALEVPQLTARVNDTAGMFSQQAVSETEAILSQFEASDSTQIVVLTVPSLEGNVLEDFSIRVVEAWKIGQKGLDNGVLLLITRDDRRLRIEVGYGLEGSLTDLTAGRIIGQVIVPRFKEGDFDRGLTDGVQAMIKAVRGEFTASTSPVQSQENDPAGLLFLLVFAFIAISRFFHKKQRKAAIAGGIVAPLVGFLMLPHLGLLLLLFIPLGAFAGFFVALFSSSGGGFYMGSGGGFGGSSGGFGGGFGGGGGGFGGGGASGGW